MTPAEPPTPADPLEVTVHGDGPPLVAVHGAVTGGRLTFGGVADRWGGHSRVLVVDRPGFGTTGGPPEPVGAQARRLLATIDAHAAGGPVDAVGHSAGGLVVLRAVEQRPAAFRTITLVETAAVDLVPDRLVHAQALVDPVREALAGVDADLTEVAVAALERTEPRLLDALRGLLTSDDPGVAVHRVDLAVWEAMLDRARLAEVVSDDPPIPVLTVSGTTSHPGMRTFGTAVAAALYGRHEVVEGAGHAAHLHPAFDAVLSVHIGRGPS